MTPAQKQLIEWIRHRDPALLNLAKKRQRFLEARKMRSRSMSARSRMRRHRRRGGLHGLGEDTQQKVPFWQTLVETAKEVLPSVISMGTQKKILDIQIKRAEAGLPPLNAEQYIPPIKVAAEVSPETEAALTRVAQESTKTGIAEIGRKVAPFAIPAAILWVLLGRKKK